MQGGNFIVLFFTSHHRFAIEVILIFVLVLVEKRYKGRNVFMSESMKIVKLKNYGIPSYIVNIWEKHYSLYLLPLQEDAVKKYGVLDWGEEITGLPRRFAPRNDKREDVCNDREIDSRFRGNYIRGSGGMT